MSMSKCKYEGTGVWEGRCTGTKEVDPCIGYEKCKSYRPDSMTNADRIRAMTDEELAKFMAERNVNESTLLLLNEDHSLTAAQIATLKHRVYCACMQWLKQPAEEGE